MKHILKFSKQQIPAFLIILVLLTALCIMFFGILKGAIVYDSQHPQTQFLVGFLGGILWTGITGGLLKGLFDIVKQLHKEHLDFAYNEYIEEISPNSPRIKREELDKL